MSEDRNNNEQLAPRVHAERDVSSPHRPSCGLVMPISSIDGCPAGHWIDVQQVLREALEAAGYRVELVSEATDVGVIQKRIVENLYSNDVVVCDVSGKNPNVMFELGMRLAFDKAVVIIKDDVTPYSFDTSPIEHLTYPRDLRYGAILDFKEKLVKKVVATYEKSSDPGFSPFLKHFGTFTKPTIESREVPADTFLLEQFQELKQVVQSVLIERRTMRSESILDAAERALPEALLANVFANLRKMKSRVTWYDFVNECVRRDPAVGHARVADLLASFNRLQSKKS